MTYTCRGTASGCDETNQVAEERNGFCSNECKCRDTESGATYAGLVILWILEKSQSLQPSDPVDNAMFL